MKAIRQLIVRMATENAGWGYGRIRGELKKLDHDVAKSTIAKTLKEHGIQPAPDRPTSWRTFLKVHADVIAAADFFTTEVWTARGLVTHYVLFVIHHATRAVHIAGITTNPNTEFMAQFRQILNDARIEVVRTAFLAPNMNAYAERWVKSVKTVPRPDHRVRPGPPRARPARIRRPLPCRATAPGTRERVDRR